MYTRQHSSNGNHLHCLLAMKKFQYVASLDMSKTVKHFQQMHTNCPEAQLKQRNRGGHSPVLVKFPDFSRYFPTEAVFY